MYLVCLLLNLVVVFISIWTTALNLITKDNTMSVEHFMDLFALCAKVQSCLQGFATHTVCVL
jgi:hypothetical protein